MARITSRQHAVVQTFRHVGRGDATRALIDGWHLLHDAVRAGLTVDVVALAGTPAHESDRALVDRLSHTTSVVQVTESVLAAVSPVRTPSGVAAIVRRPPSDLAPLLRPDAPLVLVAVGLQDPGNAGAMIRSAEAGGAAGVVLAGDSADPWGWRALRAAMGSTFRLPVVRHRDALELCGRLREAGLRLVACEPRGGAVLYDTDLRAGTALLLGGEGAGLAADVLAQTDACVSIPMPRQVESLNVAVAAAVLVYEAHRQRRPSARPSH